MAIAGVVAWSRTATLVPQMWVNLGFGDEGRTRTTNLNPSLGLRLSPSLRVNVGASVGRVEDDSQWYANFADPNGATHHTFAHLDRRTVSTSVRVSYTATPDLTFEFYGEPFTTSGTYSNVRELSATPGARAYEDRYTPYEPLEDAPATFSFSRLRTNAVLRWEFRPGSTLFVVWAHGREDYVENEPRRAWDDDVREMFSLHPDNTFLIKVAYWLSR
jgi:hypothetical protein